MKNTLILISGIPGAGKTSFAEWLAHELSFPLVCYDNIMKKANEIFSAYGDDLYRRLMPEIANHFPYFNVEEIMKTSSPLIYEYFFADMMIPTLDRFVSQYLYKTINVHFDAEYETAYKRYIKRNNEIGEEMAIRPNDISLEKYIEGVMQNKTFRYGKNIIYVDSTDFSKVSYNDIAEQIRKYASA